MKIQRISRPWQNKPQHKSYGFKTNSSKFYHSSEWRNLRKEFLSDNPLCVECVKIGEVESAKIVDHIVPIRKGGHPTDRSNLQGLCTHHNAIKTAKDK